MQNVGANSADGGIPSNLSETESHEPEEHLQLPSHTPTQGAIGRFRVTTARVGGTLSALPAEMEDVYHKVAQCILSDGYLSLTDAAEMLGKKHTGRAKPHDHHSTR